MKILISADTYYPHVNGASYSAQRFAQGLAKAGHQVSVIAPSPTLFSAKETRNGVTVYGLPSLPIFFYSGFRFVLSPVAASGVKKIMQEIKPDILHMEMHFAISSSALSVARKQGIPVVVTNHFMPENLVHYFPIPRLCKKWLVALFWKDAARVYRKTDMVISPTKTAEGVLERWLGSEKNMVLSNGVDMSHFHPGHDTALVKEKYRLPKKPLLLYVGRLDKEKNIDAVIKAMAATKEDFHFVVAGKGANSKKLESLAFSLGQKDRVSFIGFVPDEFLPALYSSADCFINAGVAELQGMSVMEAMASGLPVLAARAVALPELVYDGQNGFLFDPKDIETLSKHMSAIFKDSNKRKEMGQKSLEIIKPHDFSSVMLECQNLYRRLLLKDKSV